MSVLRILELSPSHAFGYNRKIHALPFRTIIDQYQFENINVTSYNVLYLTYFVDQEYLFQQKEKIAHFLDDGKVVVFCGHLFRKWLPGCPPMLPKPIQSHRDYIVQPIEGAPLFEGVKVEDMVYNKGVAGFFARGYYQPPKHAEVCLTFTDGKVITYIDRHTTKGTIIVHAGRSLLDYANSQKTTDKISQQLIALLEKEVVKVGVT